MYEGLKQAKPGNRVSDISHAIESYAKPFGYGIVEEFTGHGIGQSLHEEPYVPNFGKAGEGPILKKGMTFCVEPMFNMGTKEVRILSDNWTTITLDRKPSAHFEHMIVITDDGYEILTDLKRSEVMAKEILIEVEAKVIEVLPNTKFKVEFTNGHVVLAHVSGKIRMNNIHFTLISVVELSPYDLSRGRITYRRK